MTLRSPLSAIAFTLSLCAATTAFAAEGVERAVDGAASTITSPGKVVEGVADETSEHGAVGVVTGSVKGGATAAGQAVKGAADVGVGVLEAVTSPLTD